jgi:RNA polymerase sigma-70 factor, ECF subfamily
MSHRTHLERKRAPSLSPAIQEHVGKQLRALLNPMPGAALPDELQALVKRLEAALIGTGPSDELRDQMLAAVPSLRAFALSLTRNFDDADDLVQEAVVKAWAAFDRFEPGTNLNAWLFTILRNQFHTNYRKRRREVEDGDGTFAARLKAPPEQDGVVALHELQAALQRLPAEQREALVLIGVERVSYEEAASICGVAVGTVKSRVNRARSKLAELIGIASVEDLGPDRTMRAMLAS